MVAQHPLDNDPVDPINIEWDTEDTFDHHDTGDTPYAAGPLDTYNAATDGFQLASHHGIYLNLKAGNPADAINPGETPPGYQGQVDFGPAHRRRGSVLGAAVPPLGMASPSTPGESVMEGGDHTPPGWSRRLPSKPFCHNGHLTADRGAYVLVLQRALHERIRQGTAVTQVDEARDDGYG